MYVCMYKQRVCVYVLFIIIIIIIIIIIYIRLRVCMCVRERERERESVCFVVVGVFFGCAFFLNSKGIKLEMFTTGTMLISDHQLWNLN